MFNRSGCTIKKAERKGLGEYKEKRCCIIRKDDRRTAEYYLWKGLEPYRGQAEKGLLRSRDAYFIKNKNDF